MSRQYADIGVAMNTKADLPLSGWIPADGLWLVAVLTDDSVLAYFSRLKRQCPFVLSPTVNSSPEANEKFYWDSPWLLRSLYSTKAVIVAANLDAQVGCLEETEKDVCGSLAVPADCIDSDDHVFLSMHYFWRILFYIKCDIPSLKTILLFTALNWDWPHGHWLQVIWTNQALLITLVYTSEFRSWIPYGYIL